MMKKSVKGAIMAFLNKLNDLAKSLGDMTNDAIGTSKLNGKIREERKAVDELLHEIGAYYLIIR